MITLSSFLVVLLFMVICSIVLVLIDIIVYPLYKGIMKLVFMKTQSNEYELTFFEYMYVNNIIWLAVFIYWGN